MEGGLGDRTQREERDREDSYPQESKEVVAGFPSC